MRINTDFLSLLKKEVEYIIELAPAEKKRCRNKNCEQKKGRTTMNIIKHYETAAGRLCYDLTRNNINGHVCYGVRVTTTLFGEEETESVDDIASDLERAAEFVRIIADNAVLPCTLKDIAADYVTEECMV